MDTLYELMTAVENNFGVRLCVHDVSGITFSARALNLPYVWKSHGCAYCMAAKGYITEKRCMLQKQLALWRLRRNGARPFFGVCNMGVCDYLLPVKYEGRLLAVVFASGVTCEDREEARLKLRTQAARAALPEAEVLSVYDAFAAKAQTTRAALRFFAELAGDMILRNAPHGLGQVAPMGGDAPYPVEAVQRRHTGIIEPVLQYLDENYTANLSLNGLASLFFMSEGHLCRLFRKEMGMSVMTYLRKLRVSAAASELMRTDKPIREIAEQVGFDDPNYFCRVFHSVMNVTPTVYRKQNQNG